MAMSQMDAASKAAAHQSACLLGEELMGSSFLASISLMSDFNCGVAEDLLGQQTQDNDELSATPTNTDSSALAAI
ncbi:hypothetical protein PROFUN_16764 [Planoprotostelium fungivorum]|uniref:Uncharacterized protein n=1 Tax=Planoprotostelium fungivorum TaxID=1890364 RepID=A0A2P6MPI4_9EUKA|nr:hypothetical protein PROFUN_16764 [Planoprotostelium fungivorum]